MQLFRYRNKKIRVCGKGSNPYLIFCRHFIIVREKEDDKKSTVLWFSLYTYFRNRWRCMQPRVCNYCWKTFSNSFNLKQHIVNVHVQSQGVTCNVCQKVVKNKWYLRKHLVTAHGAPLKRAKNLPSTGLVDVNENEEKMADDETELKYSSSP